jgi:hypothetical protein
MFTLIEVGLMILGAFLVTGAFAYLIKDEEEFL